MQQALKNIDMSLYDLCFHSNFGPPIHHEDAQSSEITEIHVPESGDATEDDETDRVVVDCAELDDEPDISVFS